MTEPTYIQRFAELRVIDSMQRFPVTLIHGPRQCGKTTLAKRIGKLAGYAYVDFDDIDTLKKAQDDPGEFVRQLPKQVILDEVQRVPFLMAGLKSIVDEDRVPGRFILAGSANILLIPKLSDSLAGRMTIRPMGPLAQCELEENRSTFLDALFEREFDSDAGERQRESLADRIAVGGYPEMVTASAESERTEWSQSYVETIVQRELRELSHIHAFGTIPKLLEMMASQTAQLINISTLAKALELNHGTIKSYLGLLKQAFLLTELPAWHNLQTARLARRPKYHFSDTGLVCSLLGLSAADLYQDKRKFGHVLETFVLQELLRIDSWSDRRHSFSHYRHYDGLEVDLVIERGMARVAGIEVKASGSVGPSDFRGLRKLQKVAGEDFVVGVVLYDGRYVTQFDEHLYAVPIWALWGSP